MSPHLMVIRQFTESQCRQKPLQLESVDSILTIERCMVSWFASCVATRCTRNYSPTIAMAESGKLDRRRTTESRASDVNCQIQLSKKVCWLNATAQARLAFIIVHDIDKRWPDCEYWSYVASWLDFNLKRINVKFSCKNTATKWRGNWPALLVTKNCDTANRS